MEHMRTTSKESNYPTGFRSLLAESFTLADDRMRGTFQAVQTSSISY
jgi:hypothetical protein